MQIWHVTNEGTRLNVLEKVHTYRENKRDNQTKAVLKAAERIWAPVKFFFEPPNKDRQASRTVRKHSSVSYARWPLASRSVNMTNHYLFTFGTIQKDKNIRKINEPRGPDGPPDLGNFYQLLPPRRVWYYPPKRR